MGKIVKYCADCEEGFAEKFGFCPNCGGHLAAYEMNPLTGMQKAEPEAAAPLAGAESSEAASETLQGFPAANLSPQSYNTETTAENSAEPILVEKAAAPKAVQPAPVHFERAAGVASVHFDGAHAKFPAHLADDGQYHITFVEEKDNGTRGALLLGAFALVMALTVGATVYSLFANSLFVGALEDEGILNTYVAAVDNEPEPIEVEPPKPKSKDDGGGGGGGGKEDPNPVSKGVIANQEEKPLFPPTAHQIRTSDPIPITRATQGTVKAPPTDQPYGNPNSKFNVPSDGPGSGGGMGSGQGRGQGSGIGTGAGTGIGSGMGGGRGNGTGNGTGDGGDGDDAPPPVKPKPVGPTEGVKLLVKPKATYTDAARQNQVTGVVRVRVTFLPNGAIGSVTPVSTLPYGLTDQALAAARSIKFEPAKKAGVPVASTKVVEYVFSMY